jgi:hypothetical protein
MSGPVGPGAPLEPDDLRIGTRERDAAVIVLGDHFVAGRLDLEEYQQRVDAAFHARTRGALRVLFRDLPPAGRAAAPGGAAPGADGAGRLPERLRAELAADVLLILDENLRGSITYRGYRTPTEYADFERVAAAGAVAVSVGRLVVWAANAKRVDVPFGHRLRAAVTLSAEEPGLLLVTVDAHAAHPDRSGLIELRLHTPNAATIRDLSGIE